MRLPPVRRELLQQVLQLLQPGLRRLALRRPARLLLQPEQRLLQLGVPQQGEQGGAPNLPFSAAWLMTTAKSRPAALITVTRRCAGDWMRKSSLEKSSCLPGRVARALISSTVITLPSTMPSLKVNSAWSLIQVESALARATGSPEV